MLKDFSKEKFDIIIQAGQSNSDGTGFGDVEKPYEPNEFVWYMNGDFTMSPASERVAGNCIQSNYSLTFAQEYMDNGILQGDRKLLVLRTSVGGTGFLDHRWGMEDDLYLRMMEMIRTALALNPQNRLVALLWHQGETDALLHAGYEGHYNNLMTLLRSVREEFQMPELPFVAGDFVQHWIGKNQEICAPVLAAIRDVCRDCGNGTFVETDGLLSNWQEYELKGIEWLDDIHFSRESLYKLGRRYFEAFRKVR